MENDSRNNKLDLLKTIGIFGIILAHVSPPGILLEFRTFDVPLLIILSGIAFDLTHNTHTKITTYYKKRILRLIAPTWSFLLFYFIYFSIADLITNSHTVSLDIILKSFLLLNSGGIGYLWIIRVFVLVSIGAPLVNMAKEKIKSNLIYFTLVALFFTIYFFIEISAVKSVIIYRSNFMRFLITEYLLYLVPYLLIFSIGLRLPRLSNRVILVLISVCILLICSAMLMVGLDASLFMLKTGKYPPQPFWTIYGITISLFFCYIINYVKLSNKINNLICFISSSSIWIYFWHIFILKNWGYGISHVPTFANNYIFMFIIVILFATIVTYIQKSFFKYIIGNDKPTNLFESYISISFLK